ncbi:MAG: hypothetical protein QOD60_2093 [Solirubrobacterales bacterium]|jgi:hypothetical protein|nr:hypothetical protein [Solirubrobacterales bacterium]
MRRRAAGFLIAGVAAGVLVVAAPAAAAPVADASCVTPFGYNIAPNPGSLKAAQVFTAQHTGKLVTGQFGLKNPAASTAGDWLFEVAATAGGAPGAILASQTVPDTLPPTGPGVTTPVTATFANPVAVTVGTSYALLISRPGSNNYEVNAGAADVCPGQQNYNQLTVGGPFIADNGVDLGFATTVDVATGERAAALKKCKKKHPKKKRKKCRKKAKKKPL